MASPLLLTIRKQEPSITPLIVASRSIGTERTKTCRERFVLLLSDQDFTSAPFIMFHKGESKGGDPEVGERFCVWKMQEAS